MARIFIDGFEGGDLSLWDGLSGGPVINSSLSGRDGTYCANLNDITRYISKTLPNDDEYYVACKYHPTSIVSGCGIAGFLEGSTRHVMLRVSPTGAVGVARGIDTDLFVSSSAGIISSNTWYLIEIYVKIADSGGRFIVRINGGSYCIDYTGDTKNGGSGVINSVRFGHQGVNQDYGYCYLDNIIVDNAAWVGNTRIQSMAPTGAGASAGWTPSAGNNYACVDEIPASDSDYITASTADVIDTYAAADVSGSSIKCVAVQSRGWQEGWGSLSKIKHIVRPASTNREGDSIQIPVSPLSLQTIWNTNPEDSSAWELADVNGMEIGIKAVTS